MRKETRHSRQELLKSNDWYPIEQDLLAGLLEEEKTYTLAEVNQLLQEEKRRIVWQVERS